MENGKKDIVVVDKEAALRVQRPTDETNPFEPVGGVMGPCDPWIGVRKGQHYDMPTPAGVQRANGGDV